MKLRLELEFILIDWLIVSVNWDYNRFADSDVQPFALMCENALLRFVCFGQIV